MSHGSESGREDAGWGAAQDAGDGAARGRSGVTRRQLLTGSAAASLAAVIAGHPDGPTRLLASLARDVGGVPIGHPSTSTMTFSVEREADLVLLDITFHNFYLNSGGGQTTSLVPAANNVIVVQFPPQAIGEAVYPYAKEAEWPVDPPPILSAVSGPSRLCFTLDSDQQVEFTTMTAADLLDWSSWTLLVPEVAQVNESELDRILAGSAARAPAATPATTPAPPSELVTSIEYPYALFLAPTVYKGGPLFGFTTTFTGRKEPLLGEPSGTYLEGPVADCWSAALQVSYYNNYRFNGRELEDGGPEIVFHGPRGVEYTSPPPQRKPEVAAIWAQDYASEPDGATPEVEINYNPVEPKLRRQASVRTGGRGAPRGSLPDGARGTPPGYLPVEGRSAPGDSGPADRSADRAGRPDRHTRARRPVRRRVNRRGNRRR